MLKSLTLKFTVVCGFVFSMVVDSAAQTRIRFGRGRTSATVSGRVAGENGRDYILKAAAGQTMYVKIRSDNGEVTANAGQAAGKDFSFTLDNDGDIEITVYNSGRRASRYTMTVSIR
jgi:outer membrane lipoprotein SlyB